MMCLDIYTTSTGHLNILKTMLNKKGSVIISIPIAAYAWETYKENWIQLDAPRHAYIHTEKYHAAACRAAWIYNNKKIDYNSWGMQFWGSEQYKMDVPLIHEKSYPVNNNSGLFTPLQIDAWEKRSKKN